MSTEKIIELIVEYFDGNVKTYTLVKYNIYDNKPNIQEYDNVIEFKYVAMGKVRTKIIPYSAIKSAELYEE